MKGINSMNVLNSQRKKIGELVTGVRLRAVQRQEAFPEKRGQDVFDADNPEEKRGTWRGCNGMR
jgi:hypothetical protein